VPSQTGEGRINFGYENGLVEMVMKNLRGGRLVGPTRPMPALHAAAAMREQGAGVLPAGIVRHHGPPTMTTVVVHVVFLGFLVAGGLG
jgi:hypothetical protein